MKKSIGLLIVVLLVAGTAFGQGGTYTMTVTANVASVWEVTDWHNTYDFGELSTADLAPGGYNSLTWFDRSTSNPGQYIGFSIRTNEDYQITVAGAANLSTAYDNLGGGPSGLPNYSPLANNAEIETQYKFELWDWHWYDNGNDDTGANGALGFPWTDASGINGILLDAGTGINPVGTAVSWTQYWTGGFRGNFRWYPRIKPIGLGQQPGSYNDTWTLTVVKATYTPPT